MNDMEKDFRNIVEDALKKLEEGGTELSSGIVFLYGEKDDKFLRVMRSTSEDKSRFVQNAVELAKKAGLDYEGIEGELGHLFFCQCLCADMEEIALKSLEEKIGSRKSPKKESKKLDKFSQLMGEKLIEIISSKRLEEEQIAGVEAANNRKEGE